MTSPLGLPLYTLAEAVRLAGELQDVRPMREPVEQGSSETLVAEDLCPVSEAQVGGDNHGHALVKGRAELEDQLRASGRERNEAQLVQDNQAMPESSGQELGQVMLVLGLDQFVDQARRVIEAHTMSLPAGSQGKAGRNVRLPQTGIPDQEDRLGFVQVAAPRQFQHPLLVQAGHAGEVKVGQFLRHRETSGVDAAHLAVLLSPGNLLLGQGQQVAVLAEIGLSCVLGKLAVVVQEGRQPQLLEVRFQEHRRFHHPILSSNRS